MVILMIEDCNDQKVKPMCGDAALKMIKKYWNLLNNLLNQMIETWNPDVEMLHCTYRTCCWSSPVSGSKAINISLSDIKPDTLVPGMAPSFLWFSDTFVAGTRTRCWGCSGAKWSRRGECRWTSCWSRCLRRTHSDRGRRLRSASSFQWWSPGWPSPGPSSSSPPWSPLAAPPSTNLAGFETSQSKFVSIGQMLGPFSPPIPTCSHLVFRLGPFSRTQSWPFALNWPGPIYNQVSWSTLTWPILVLPVKTRYFLVHSGLNLLKTRYPGTQVSWYPGILARPGPTNLAHPGELSWFSALFWLPLFLSHSYTHSRCPHCHHHHWRMANFMMMSEWWW